MRWTRYPVQEEEEGGGGGGGGYAYSVPQSLKTLAEWFQDAFAKRYSYPVYGILLLDKNNHSALELIAKSRSSLSAIAGSDICFAYFRDGKRAENMTPWSVDEHIKYAIHIASIFGLGLPSIVFFSSLVMKDEKTLPHLVHIDLQNKSPEQALLELSRVFTHYYSKKGYAKTPIERLDFAKKVVVGKGLAITGARSAARDAAVEFFKAVGKSMLSAVIG